MPHKRHPCIQARCDLYAHLRKDGAYGFHFKRLSLLVAGCALLISACGDESVSSQSNQQRLPVTNEATGGVNVPND